MTTEAKPSDASSVTGLGLGFASSKILLTALELGLFTLLARGPRTRQQLCTELGLQGRGSTEFLTALVAMGLLERDGEQYLDSGTAARLLVRGPGYAGGFLEGANAVLYPAWGGLSDALRTGMPQNSGDFEQMLTDPGRQRMYLAMMDSLSGPLAPDLAAALDWRTHSVVTDVGGARGNMVSLLLREHGHLSGVVFDRPQNAGACAEHSASLGVGERVTFTGGDFFTDELPATDVMIIGHVLADFAPAERELLVHKAFRAVRPGGALLVYDPMPDPDSPDLDAAVAGMHLVVMSPGGGGYPPADCAQWMRDAGFASVSVRGLGLGNTLAIGTKSR
ncbi:methyltransferase [Streptomyces sp. NPDC001262]|uniref:methyltransferase n=1 Tax=Streptomyces sp. NPDC001262 TaxID=3364552 RepID=UPI00368C9ACE